MSATDDRLFRARQWLEKAEHDLTNAENTLLMRANCPFDTICFHAQQCAEKALKAVLVAGEKELPKTHDLVVLARLVRELRPAAPPTPPVQPLNRYTIEARYPGDWEPITREEADQAVALARAVLHFASQLLSAGQTKTRQ